MLSLPMFNKTDERFRSFGSAVAPLRPSQLGKFVSCPMSVFLVEQFGDSLGNKAAQTGNLVHAAVAEYHRKAADPAAGLEALTAAREQFPDGDWRKAETIFTAYAADPVNQNAQVFVVEHPVRLVLAPAADDPTGEPVVVEGTLDQIRIGGDGIPRVWDVKTGERLPADETVDEYLIQQAAYTLAARESVEPDVEPGGIIYTPNYSKPRGRRHLPLKIDVETCKMLMIAVVDVVATIRRGTPLFRPSAESCRYCPVRPFTQCSAMFKGVYS